MVQEQAPQEKPEWEMKPLSDDQIRRFREQFADLLLDLITDPSREKPVTLSDDAPDIIRNGGKIDRSTYRKLTKNPFFRGHILNMTQRNGLTSGQIEFLTQQVLNG
ncbi:MAG: hypothetical protein Q8R36_01090 [bacterium]|nr:hypothetical protein [bacterium]